uniref:ACB domain-containing protein n=1 Tax=Knipowitschia caucasica TaxID=637954 RepID=A0AAV2JTX7_KNICA
MLGLGFTTATDMASEEDDEYSLEDKFDAAVKVIWTLPEDGPFQPSDDMMLMFYSYYTQAIQGPCNVPRPLGFWDTRGKAKWDAWSALGNMTREEAMKNYVDNIQLILETIPISNEVTDLVRKLGNFFTEAESNDEDTEENEVDRRPFTRPFANHTEQVIQPTIQGYGDLWDDIQNVPDIATSMSPVVLSLRNEKEIHGVDDIPEEEEIELKELLMAGTEDWSSDSQKSDSSSKEPSVSSVTNVTHSSLNSEVEEVELACSIEPPSEHIPNVNFIEHLSDHMPAGIIVRSTDSDNEEFCDSMEHLAIEQSDLGFMAFSALNCSRQSGLVDGIRTADFRSALSRRQPATSEPTCGSQLGINVNMACCCVSQSTRSLYNPSENMNEHIASALLRLQQDMDNVLQKLQTLEILQTPQPPSPSPEQHPLTAALQFIKPSWWRSHSTSVFFTLFWPVLVHWLVQMYVQRRRRIL